ARLPAAPEARYGRRPLRRQRVGRRLPPGRRSGRGGGGVSGLALLGWIAAGACSGLAVLLQARLIRHASLVADAGHELRGPPGPVRELVDGSGRGRAWRRSPRASATPRGRGLAIAARIAERHGGRLAVGPSAGGACLVLELPCADGSPPLAG